MNNMNMNMDKPATGHTLTTVWNENMDWCAVFMDGKNIGGGHDQITALRDALTLLGVDVSSITVSDDYFTDNYYPDGLPVENDADADD